MAHLPEVRKKDPPSPRARKLAKLLIKGYPVSYIVERLAGDDPVKAHVIRSQIGRLIHNDEEVQQAIGQAASGLAKAEMQGVVEAVNRRAVRGNIPAAKLAMEVSGFHNPRMEHHHSGRIEIELKGVPRPVAQADESEADVVDADVVDE